MKKMHHNKTIRIVTIAITVLILLCISCFVFYKSNLKAVRTISKQVPFHIQQGDTSNTIVTHLKENKLIKNKAVTKLYMKLHGVNNLKAGDFLIDPSWDTSQVLGALSDASKTNANEVKITFKEGMWAKDVAKLINEKLGIPQQELLNLWNNDVYLKELIKTYPFLTKDILNKNYKVKLEGYLFPETYIFSKNATPKDVTKTFLDYFNVIYNKYETAIKKSHMSVQQVVTFSSMVQYEGSTKEDMDMIAGVFDNRLKANMPLDSSVTVCYALYDKMNSQDDCEANTQIKSPYNTYTNLGLPIGPILNPGEDAIHAVLYPKKNDYLYFVADIYGSGKVIYSKTLAQQEANIDKYHLRK